MGEHAAFLLPEDETAAEPPAPAPSFGLPEHPQDAAAADTTAPDESEDHEDTDDDMPRFFSDSDRRT